MTTELATIEQTAIQTYNTREQLDLIKRTVAPDLDDGELLLFGEVATRLGLDPFTKQVYAIKRYDSQLGRERMTIQTGIDGFRAKAEETGLYKGSQGPYWCGPDGKWVDVWLAGEPPAAARVGVLRADWDTPAWWTVRYDAYVQRNKQGRPVSRWSSDPSGMLAKCAESGSFRKAFPQQLSGVYTDDEMAQADTVPPPQVTVVPPPNPLVQQLTAVLQRANETRDGAGQRIASELRSTFLTGPREGQPFGVLDDSTLQTAIALATERLDELLTDADPDHDPAEGTDEPDVDQPDDGEDPPSS